MSRQANKISNQFKDHTLCCFIFDSGRVLLASGVDTGRGKMLSGICAGVLEGETAEEALFRALGYYGLRPSKVELCGTLECRYEGKDKNTEESIYKIESYSGEPRPPEGVDIEWHDLQSLPAEKMRPDLIDWLPYLAAGKKFRGELGYDKRGKLINKNINIIPE